MISPKDKLEFQKKILTWYRTHARDLPWRSTSDPYRIWVSEIMLQQTRVETVIPYYQRWLAEYSSLEDLAEADEDQVLSLWEGLGYYSRARNMHRTARIIAEKYQGDIPQDINILKSLPGIGPYTAGAIASIAFNQPAAILDGNLRRVFTRYFNINTPIGTAETENSLWQIAAELLPEENPGDFNQGLMELGALVCLPKNPDCDCCPVNKKCQAKELDLQHKRPVRKEKKPLPHLQVAAGVLLNDDRVLLAKRPTSGLLGGMWEYPGGTQEMGETLPETLKREIREELEIEIDVGEILGVFQHAYTHYRVTLQAYYCTLVTGEIKLNYHSQYVWAPLFTLGDYPMGKLDRLISDALLAQNQLNRNHN